MNTNRVWEDRFNSALLSRDRGEAKEGLEILLELDREYPNEPAIVGMTGSLYWELKEYERARDWYRRAVELSPKSELASIGLFHSLWRTGDRDAALQEMNRLEQLRSSEEYQRLRGELGLPPRGVSIPE
jgi:predicted Zn-dependent protease